VEIPESGASSSYYIKQKIIGLDAIPDDSQVLTIIYWSSGGAISSDSDVPIIPDEHQLLLVYFTCIQMALEGDDDRIGKFNTLWNDGVAQARREVVERYFSNMWPVASEVRQELDPVNHDVGF
jgi:hypothetical protein